jgi:hypothetical protein
MSESPLIQHKTTNNNADGQYNCGEVYSLAITIKPIRFFAIEDQQLKGFPKPGIKQLHSNQSKNGYDSPNTFAQL